MHDLLLIAAQVGTLGWIFLHRGAVSRRYGKMAPLIGSLGPIVVLFLCMLPETHSVHELIEQILHSGAVRALESLAALGGWSDEFGAHPPGLVPKIDLADSILRPEDYELLTLQVSGKSDVCSEDELQLWDRLGADLSSLAYDETYARLTLSQRLPARLGLSGAQEIPDGPMPEKCQHGNIVCFRWVRLGSTNAALFVRVGEILAVGHRGTLFNSVRDLLRALQTRVVIQGNGKIHRGWAIADHEEIEALSLLMVSWSSNAKLGISAGHSKGGSRAQHFVARLGGSMVWHSRSFSAPHWVEYDEKQADIYDHVLSNVNFYVVGDPIFMLFEYLGFSSQLGAELRPLEKPQGMGFVGSLYWMFRAHFLSHVSEHMTGEKIERHAYQRAILRGLAIASVIFCLGFFSVSVILLRTRAFLRHLLNRQRLDRFFSSFPFQPRDVVVRARNAALSM